MPNSKNYKRNYKQEYKSYHAKPTQKKNRAARNAARAKMMAAGKVRKGDGKDVDHKKGMSNKMSNLRVKPKSSNRSFPRTKTAGKKR